MLRLHGREADDVITPPRADTPWKVMTAQPVPHVSETIELHKPGAPDQVVRLGPTITQVVGFGPHREVVRWLADAMIVPPLVIGPDALDDLRDLKRQVDHLEPHDRQILVERVGALADRADEIESALAAMGDTHDDDDDERASAALALAVEWDAYEDAVRNGRADTASREIEMRARTASLLGRLAGVEPAVDLRAFAQEIIRRQPNPDAAVALRSELDRIEAEGRDLVTRIDAADGLSEPAVRINELFGDERSTIVLDGDLFYAVPSTVYDLLLDKLHDEASRRRIAIVFDDTTLEAWLDTVHGATSWTTGHLHLVQDAAAAPESALAGPRPVPVMSMCGRHPTQPTRLVCSGCRRPFCSLCLVRVTTRDAVLCIDCALERGTGVKRPHR
jgi:hypothetical protein